MKSWLKALLTVSAISLASSLTAFGQGDEGYANEGPWLLSMRLGGQFMDNRDGVENNKESNLDLFIEPRADFRFRDGERTLLDLAVLPMVKWHSNPRTLEEGSAQNDTELFGTVALELMHQLSPRVTLTVGDAFTYNDDPEMNNGGANVRSSNNHIWNTSHAGVDVSVTETMATGVTGNYALKRYDDSEVAANEDEDIVDGQAYLKFKTSINLDISGLVGYSDFKNKSTERQRGSQVMSAGIGIEKRFSPDLIGKVAGGYQHGEYENSEMSSLDTPNGSAELVMRAASITRFRVGGSYGLYAPYVRPYSIQTLTAFKAGVDHDVLPGRLTLSLNGQYGTGDYKEEGADLPGGTDNMVSVGVGVNYRVNRTWSVGGGYTYENWDSNMQERESFSRNMVDLGVKAQM
ncbi:MAG: outer membrane beta-barrel protein [bacterium]